MRGSFASSASIPRRAHSGCGGGSPPAPRPGSWAHRDQCDPLGVVEGRLVDTHPGAQAVAAGIGQGTPLACTRAPGAWPTIRMRAPRPPATRAAGRAADVRRRRGARAPPSKSARVPSTSVPVPGAVAVVLIEGGCAVMGRRSGQRGSPVGRRPSPRSLYAEPHMCCGGVRRDGRAGAWPWIAICSRGRCRRRELTAALLRRCLRRCASGTRRSRSSWDTVRGAAGHGGGRLLALPWRVRPALLLAPPAPRRWRAHSATGRRGQERAVAIPRLVAGAPMRRAALGLPVPEGTEVLAPPQYC